MIMQMRFGLTTPEFRVIPSEVFGWLTCNVGDLPSRRGSSGAGPGPGPTRHANHTSHVASRILGPSRVPLLGRADVLAWVDRLPFLWLRINTQYSTVPPRIDLKFKVTTYEMDIKLRLSDLRFLACLLCRLEWPPPVALLDIQCSLFVASFHPDALCIVSPCCQDPSANKRAHR